MSQTKRSNNERKISKPDKNLTITSLSPKDDKKQKKKTVKHSKKFVRTQTGCLQCRQKKKKCDGKRPTCLSCEKRGICCKFPENIRLFQFNPINTESTSVKKPKAIISQHDMSNKKESKLETSINIINFSFKDESKSIITNRRSSTSSNTPSLISDNSDFSDSEISQQIPILPTQETSTTYNDLHLLPAETHHLDPAEEALVLANDGKSINNILNTITIDLIKQSINNLQYIDFDSKSIQNNKKTDPLEINKAIRNGLQFADNNNPKDQQYEFEFKPDEFFRFEG